MEVTPRVSIPLIGGLSPPVDGLDVVFAFAVCIRITEAVLSVRVPILSAPPKFRLRVYRFGRGRLCEHGRIPTTPRDKAGSCRRKDQ